MIKTFQRPPITSSVVSTGQATDLRFVFFAIGLT